MGTPKVISLDEMKKRGRPVGIEEFRNRAGELQPQPNFLDMEIREFKKALTNLVSEGTVRVYDVDGELFYMLADSD